MPPVEEVKRRQRKDLHEYQGYDYLDAGGQGMVSVYMETDEHGKILSRVAAKDIYLDERHWKHMEWIDGLPADIGGMYRLQNQTTSVKPLRIEGHDVFAELRMYEMRLEFAPHADLWDTLKRCRATKVRVPEPFLWYVQKSMVETGVLMGEGDLVTSKTPWRILVHKDIKLDNVVLAPPLDNEFPSYPTPKVMDFGHVGEIYAGNPRPMVDQCWGGTHGWRAPERDPAYNPRGPMTQASDVYSVGLTIYHLMNLSLGGPPRLAQDGNPVFGDSDPGRLFSPTLQEVVRCMVQTDYASRPTFNYLHQFIAALFATPADQVDAMRIKALATHRLEDAERWIPDSELWRFELDYRQDMKYRLDTVCRFLEPEEEPEDVTEGVAGQFGKLKVAGKGKVKKAASV